MFGNRCTLILSVVSGSDKHRSGSTLPIRTVSRRPWPILLIAITAINKTEKKIKIHWYMPLMSSFPIFLFQICNLKKNVFSWLDLNNYNRKIWK